MSPVSVASERAGAQTVLTVAGDLGLHNVADLATPAVDALADRTVRRIVVDLAGVTFIDSTGIGELVSLRATAADVGAGFVLRNPTERIVALLRLIHMDGAFLIDPSPDPA